MSSRTTALMPAVARSVRIVFVALTAAALIACGQPSPEKLIASAKEHLAKGDRNAAVIELKNVLQQAPDNGEARLMLGQALFDAGDYVSAEKELSRALELKQPHEKVLPTYALTLLALGKHQAVVTEVEKYKLFNPAAVAATQTALGDAYRALRDLPRARDAYAAALAADPGYSRAQLGRAIVVAAEGRVDEALQLTDAVIAADPKLPDARAFRAQILLAKGDRDGARKALEEAIAADDRYLPARLTLISLLTDGRDFETAAKLVESTRTVAPTDLRVTYLAASLAFRMGNMERARQQLQQVLKYLPDDLPSLVLAGAADLQAGQYAAAESNLRKVLAQEPNHTRARQLLVRTYLSMGQSTKAKETLQPLIDRGMLKDQRLQLLAGEVALANGDVKNAAVHFQAASKGTKAQQVAAGTRLGQIALATGRTEEGMKELEAVSELDAGTIQADLALILAHLRRNEFDKAMAAVQALEKKQPTNPLTFYMYGVVNLGKSDLIGARKNFERALQLRATYLPAAQALAELDRHEKTPDDARKRFEAMIAKEPNNDDLYLALARFQVRTGAAPQEIGDSLRRAVKANPQSSAAQEALLGFELRQGDPKAALAAARDALAALPSDPQVLNAAAIAQEAAGDVNQAIDTYNRLASLQPQSVQPLYRLTALYIRQNEKDKAIESLRRVQKVSPNEQSVIPQLVLILLAAERPDEARKEARDLQRREPNAANGYALEGDVLAEQRRFAEAERLYREALKREPKANLAAVKLHGVLVAAGKSAEADAWGKKWTVDNPKDPVMRLYLGRRELDAKNLKAAAVHYRAVIDNYPNNVEALNNLAWIGGQLNDPKALGYAERAIKLEPNNVDVLDTYGSLLVAKGETEKGLRLLERGLQIAPTRNDHRLQYAKALMKAGRKDAARKELEALQGVKESFPGKDEVPNLLKAV